jgi:secretion/DNA translocation related TadE-like protein
VRARTADYEAGVAVRARTADYGAGVAVRAREADRGAAGPTYARQPDRGAASIFVLAVGLVLVALGLAGAAVGSARVARHQARNAADLGALAGAQRTVESETVACAEAARYVSANGARLTGCTVSGFEIVIRVEVAVQPLPGMSGVATAAARAGPVAFG